MVCDIILKVLIYHIDVTNDNASYTVTSNFDVLGRKFGYQKQCRLNAFYSVQDIFIDLSVCLYICVSLLLSIILVFRFLSIRSKGRTNERMNERTNEPTDSYS